MKETVLVDNEGAAHPSPEWVKAVAKEIMTELGLNKSPVPRGTVDLEGLNLLKRAREWERQHNGDRPKIEIDADAVWRHPIQNQQIGNRITVRQPVENWGIEWRNASVRASAMIAQQLAGYRYDPPAFQSPAPGPGLSGDQPREIRW